MAGTREWVYLYSHWPSPTQENSFGLFQIPVCKGREILLYLCQHCKYNSPFLSDFLNTVIFLLSFSSALVAQGIGRLKGGRGSSFLPHSPSVSLVKRGKPFHKGREYLCCPERAWSRGGFVSWLSFSSTETKLAGVKPVWKCSITVTRLIKA